MRVNPISAEKASEGGGFEPWPAGEYDFAVHDAADDVSSAGNEQIKLTLHVFNRDGNKRTVFDYLGASDKAQWKVRHFADAVGLTRQYESGELEPRDIVGREGRCRLRIKPASGGYPANNEVQDYIAASGAPQRAAHRPAQQPRRAVATAGADLDDDIPF